MSCHHWCNKRNVYRKAVRGIRPLIPSHHRWYRKLGYLSKIIANKSPNYLFKVVPASNTTYNIRNTNDIPLMNI